MKLKRELVGQVFSFPDRALSVARSDARDSGIFFHDSGQTQQRKVVTFGAATGQDRTDRFASRCSFGSQNFGDANSNGFKRTPSSLTWAMLTGRIHESFGITIRNYCSNGRINRSRGVVIEIDGFGHSSLDSSFVATGNVSNFDLLSANRLAAGSPVSALPKSTDFSNRRLALAIRSSFRSISPSSR